MENKNVKNKQMYLGKSIKLQQTFNNSHKDFVYYKVGVLEMIWGKTRTPRLLDQRQHNHFYGGNGLWHILRRTFVSIGPVIIGFHGKMPIFSIRLLLGSKMNLRFFAWICCNELV